MKKNILLAVSILTITSTIVSCSGSGQNTNNEVSENKDIQEDIKENDNQEIINNDNPLSLGLMASVDSLPILYAKEMGIFQDNGINVQLETFFSAKDRDISYLGGELTGVISDLVGISMYYTAEMPSTIITTTTAEFGLAVGPETGITTVEDLKDREILYSKNSVIDYSIDKMLEAYGLEESDLVKTEVQALPLRVEMMLKGEADSALVPEPFISISEASGADIIFRTSEIDLDMIAVAIDKEYLEENTEVIDKFLTSYDEAVTKLNEMSDEEFNDYIFTKFQYDDSLRGNLERLEYRYHSLPSEAQFNDAFNWSLNRDLIKELVPYETATYKN